MNHFLLLLTLSFIISLQTWAKETIRISTNLTDLILSIDDNHCLRQRYFGERLTDKAVTELINLPIANKSTSNEVFPGGGTGDFYEPALSVTHADKKPGVSLQVNDYQQIKQDGKEETIIKLYDPLYPIEVALHFIAYSKENVIETWSVITHQERKPVTLWRYASSVLHFTSSSYWLTEYAGDWASEVHPFTQQLGFGQKILETRLGSRASMFTPPFFQLGIGGTVNETQGVVLLGTLAWTGNFRFTFEVDAQGGLRLVSGINPYASEYILEKETPFITPHFIFTLSQKGAGEASRNMHAWARNHRLHLGKESRYILLNNWESTGFNFNESILEGVMKEASQLGVDLFLLDDGWFGNKYPRNNDQAGLGDWEPMHSKLPGGITKLEEMAKRTNIKLGLWVEPEMVNPHSELYEKHPEWAAILPDRKPIYFRHQIPLDMANPSVQQHVLNVVDKLLTLHPNISYLKWDCNSPIMQPYSTFLKQQQGKLFIDYVQGLYNVLDTITAHHPHVQMMLCAGGGGRCDYGALSRFTEFWCSDNTDPVERIYIQWGFSQLFPAKSMCAHVTSWNRNAPLKFRIDVAGMCKPGFDLRIEQLSKEEQEFCKQAVIDWKRRSPIIFEGIQYRLVSPYEGDQNHVALMYVDETQEKAVVFAYDLHPRYGTYPPLVRLQGLNPNKLYKLKETGLWGNEKGLFPNEGSSISGDYLMKEGIPLFTTSPLHSRVIELEVTNEMP